MNNRKKSNNFQSEATTSNEEDDPEYDALLKYYKTKSENEDKSIKLYIVFALLRVLLTFTPQSGYIHPDELIQSVEVVGGPILDAEVDLPWEYNRTNPIRSITIPYIVHGIPIWFLRQLNFLFMSLFSKNIISPYTILLYTRLVLCFASFFIDYSLYRICKLYSRPYHVKLTILATSYVMLVYATRTFSNTIEMILYSILLWMISICMFDHQLLVKFRKQFIKVSNGLETPRSRVKHLKIIKLIEDHSLQHCFMISCLAVIGCYNRPTFVMFGVGPIFFWIHRGLSSQYITVKDIHTRMFMFLISSVPLIFLFIFIDSAYFGYLTGPEILNCDISLKNFVFPPWNFLKYNIDKDNLSKHGIHPRYTHFLVNLLLLFGCLAFIMWRSVVLAASELVKKPQLSGYSRALDIDNLMRVALFAPIVLLSIIPHQEPRFIIPIILPLIFLYGDQIYNIAVKEQFTQSLFKLWMLFNIIMTLMYGFLHQGGVYHFSNFIHNEINNYPINTTFHLVTSHMYSYPRILLNQPDTNIVFKSSTGDYYQIKKRVYYYEAQSDSVNELLNQINNIYQLNIIVAENTSCPFKIYICLPSLLANEFESAVGKDKEHKIYKIASLFPHLSTEVISKPEVWELARFNILHHKILKFVSKLENVLSLDVYSLTYELKTS